MSAPVNPSVAQNPVAFVASQLGGKIACMNLEQSPSCVAVRQLHLEPQFHSAASDQRGRQVAQIHRGHHDADSRAPLAFEAVDHRQQITIEAALLTVFENRVRIVDKDDRWRVVLGSLEDLMNSLIEVLAACDEGTVDQKELASETMGERAPNRRLSCPGRAIQKHTALGLQSQLRAQGVVT